MIRVHRRPLADHLTLTERRRLAQKQLAVKSYPRQDPRIIRAWKNFRRTTVGHAIYQALNVTFRSKCAFCERVNARTADHFYPKERYPKRMFRWSNLLLCCGECNPIKGTFFPFANGRPVLLDPTRDEPLDFFTWDVNTGAMVLSTDPARQFRAQVMQQQLKLDENPLRDERKMQAFRILGLLQLVIAEHPAIRPETRRWLELELHPNRPHLGIIRFLFREPNDHRSTVDTARSLLPEIDTWTAEWL